MSRFISCYSNELEHRIYVEVETIGQLTRNLGFRDGESLLKFFELRDVKRFSVGQMGSQLISTPSSPQRKCVCDFKRCGFGSNAKHNSAAEITFFDECMKRFLQIQTHGFR